MVEELVYLLYLNLLYHREITMVLTGMVLYQTTKLMLKKQWKFLPQAIPFKKLITYH